MHKVTIEQSENRRSFIKSVVEVANGMQLKDGGKAIEFAVSGGVVDVEDGVVNELTAYKNGKEIEKKKSLVFRDGKEISTDDLSLYYD